MVVGDQSVFGVPEDHQHLLNKRSQPFQPTAAEQKKVALEAEGQTHFHFLFVEGSWDVVGVQVSPQKPGRRRLLDELREEDNLKVSFCLCAGTSTSHPKPARTRANRIRGDEC